MAVRAGGDLCNGIISTLIAQVTGNNVSEEGAVFSVAPALTL